LRALWSDAPRHTRSDWTRACPHAPLPTHGPAGPPPRLPKMFTPVARSGLRAGARRRPRAMRYHDGVHRAAVRSEAQRKDAIGSLRPATQNRHPAGCDRGYRRRDDRAAERAYRRADRRGPVPRALRRKPVGFVGAGLLRRSGEDSRSRQPARQRRSPGVHAGPWLRARSGPEPGGSPPCRGRRRPSGGTRTCPALGRRGGRRARTPSRRGRRHVGARRGRCPPTRR